MMRINLDSLRQIIVEAMLNAYSVLGLSPSATDDDVKRAWKQLAIKNHPDRGGAHADMVNINVAKDRLLDKNKLSRLGPTFKGYEVPGAAPEQAATTPKPASTPSGSSSPPTMRVCIGCGRLVAVKGNGTLLNHYTAAGGSTKCSSSNMPADRHSVPEEWAREWQERSRRQADNNRQRAQQSRSDREQRWRDEEAAKSQAGKQAGARSSRRYGQPNKSTYKVYPWRQSRRVVRIGGKLFGTEPGGRLKDGGTTKFNANDRANVRPENGRMKVSKTDSDHTQTWDPVDEVRRVVDEIIIEMITRIGEA